MTASQWNLHSLQFRFIYIFIICMLLTCLPAFAATPEVKTGSPANWVKRLDVKPVSDVPADEIQNGQYYILVDKQIQVVDNVPTQYYRHFAVQIVNAAGMETSSQISVVFDPDYQTVSFHELAILRDGKKIDKLSKTEFQLLRREEELESLIYDGRYTVNIIVDDVRVGDVIEYAYTVTGDNPIYADIFSHKIDTSWGVPVLKNYFVLRWPKTRHLFEKSHNTNLVLAREDQGDFILYSLIQEKVKPVQQNSETPTWYRRYGVIQISEAANWVDVIAWAKPLYRIAYLQNSNIKDLSNSLCQPAATDEDKVIRILNYIQNEIRYLGIEFGVNSHKPSPPQDTLERRYGDCKDKTVVLIALLTALGFETHPALVNTSLHEFVADLHPTIHAFDHVIARTTINGRQYWLDPSRKYQGQNLKKIFQPDYGMALVIAPGETGLTQMPANDQLVGANIEETFDLREGINKEALYRVASCFQGLNAENTRRQYAEEGRKTVENLYLNFYAKYYMHIVATAPVQVVDNQTQNELNLIEQYRIEDFWEKNDETQQWQCSFYPNAIYTYLNKPTQRQRHEPFSIAYPVNIHQSIRVLLPGAWNIQNSKFAEHNSHFKFASEVSYDSDTSTLKLDYHYRSFKDVVQPNELAAYMAALNRIENELDYNLIKSNASRIPWSKFAVLNWARTNLLLVVIAILTILIIFCLVEWRIDHNKYAPVESGFYYPVSLAKLVIFTVATFGYYQIFWFYRNWQYIKQRDDSAIMPFWRAVFTPIWFFPFYQDLKLDSERRLGKSILPGTHWAVLLLILLVGTNAIESFGEPYELFSLLSVLGLLPFANYILFINRNHPETTNYHSIWRIRHYLLSCFAAALIFMNIATFMNWIPSGEVVTGHQLPSWNIKFMQRRGLMNGDAELIYFYSDAFFFMRNDGNGVTDSNVFSYWYDDESGELLSHTAAYEDIEDISVEFADSKSSDDTVITINPKNGPSFILYASSEKDKDKLFVKAIRDRLVH